MIKCSMKVGQPSFEQVRCLDHIHELIRLGSQEQQLNTPLHDRCIDLVPQNVRR